MKSEVRKVLVCFAVKEEAKVFQQLAAGCANVQVLLVGIGKRNAEQAIRAMGITFTLATIGLVTSTGAAVVFYSGVIGFCSAHCMSATKRVGGITCERNKNIRKFFSQFY